jgi:phosphoribosylformimino-5-aminoimidazole carboxamide ribonucleotide (ProFAR) isomerase
MDLYARVNILDGRAVRLPRGDVADAIFLDADPVDRALGWIGKGADRLLIVDLDAAAYGDYKNRDLISDIISAVDVPVVAAGGIRSPLAVEAFLEMGAAKVGMGTAAIENQVMVWELCRDHPGRIIVSVDVGPDEELATRGWTQNSGRYLEDVLIEMSAAGAAGFMLAEVGRDALEEPPNFDALTSAMSIVEEPVIAAGGVRDLDDLSQLVNLEIGGRHLGGVVVGREVTAGRFTVEEAAALLGAGPVEVALGPWDREELESAAARYSDRAGGPAAKAVVDFLGWLADGERAQD